MSRRVANAGAHPTPAIDRSWFKSVYFKEPGWCSSSWRPMAPASRSTQSAHTLGESLVLPPWLEAQRGQIKAILPTLKCPPARPNAKTEHA